MAKLPFTRSNPVKGSTASQASRSDAHPNESLRFETYAEGRNHYIALKKKLEAELALYSKAAFSAAQLRIRKDNPHDSFAVWMRERARMEERRQQLIKRKVVVEDRLAEVKRLAKFEAVRESQEGNSMLSAKLDVMIAELIKIRELLEGQQH